MMAMASSRRLRHRSIFSPSHCLLMILISFLASGTQFSMAFRRSALSAAVLSPRGGRAPSSSYRPSRALAFMSPRESYSSRSDSVTNNDTDCEKSEIQPRKYGYAETPFTWEQLVQIIEKEQNLAKLSRSVPQQREYEDYRRKLLCQWKSVYDHVLFSKFGFDKRLGENPASDEDGRNTTLWEAYPPLDEVSEVRKILRPNNFPYYMPSHIEHWCLWKLCEDVTEGEIEGAKEDLRTMHGDVLDFLHWRNPPHLKSLPDIDHIHILCLREGDHGGSER